MHKPSAPSLRANHLLQLLLGTELVGVATLLLAAVGRSWWEAGVALAAAL